MIVVNRRELILSGLTTAICLPFLSSLVGTKNRLSNSKPSAALSPALSFLNDQQAFNELIVFLRSQDVSCQILNTHEHGISSTNTDLKLFSMNQSYGRFANFSAENTSPEKAFMVTRGPRGKLLSQNSQINVVSYLSKDILLRPHFTDALPHFYNLKYQSKKTYTSYWIDTKTRLPVNFYLQITAGAIAKKSTQSLNTILKKLKADIFEFETASLDAIKKTHPVFQFDDLTATLLPNV